MRLAVDAAARGDAAGALRGAAEAEGEGEADAVALRPRGRGAARAARAAMHGEPDELALRVGAGLLRAVGLGHGLGLLGDGRASADRGPRLTVRHAFLPEPRRGSSVWG